MKKLLGLTAAALFVGAVPAGAQAPTSNAYGGAGTVVGTVATAETPGTAVTAAGGTGTGETPAGGGVAPETVVRTTSPGGVQGSGGNGTPTENGGVAPENGGVAPESGSVAPEDGAVAPAAAANPAAADVDAKFAAATADDSSSSGATAGSLPFTGLDMGLLGAGSLLLVALGFGLRRLGRDSAPIA